MSEFRAIIVGGGPVGLTAANMFSQADIDFVLLESHNSVTPEPGSALGLYPSTLRIFDQLQVLGSVIEASDPYLRKIKVTQDGYIFDEVNLDIFRLK